MRRRYQQGGAVEGNVFTQQPARNIFYEGLVRSTVPGGFDQQPINILAGSYVLPADVPNAIGRGDSKAGADKLKWIFSSGPYGISIPHYARGGGVTRRVVQIRTQGGAYVVPPDVVRKIGEGDLINGTQALDAFVRKIRRAAEAEHAKAALHGTNW